MPKFRKNPVIVEAVQWFKLGDHPAVRKPSRYDMLAIGDSALIDTIEGPLKVSPGDWIITGVAGEHYPCKDEIFRQTYEPVEG
ncbi:MAG: hypothetical protein AB7L90_25825 [Hyphomicrobiaceae bacterium]